MRDGWQMTNGHEWLIELFCFVSKRRLHIPRNVQTVRYLKFLGAVILIQRKAIVRLYL